MELEAIGSISVGGVLLEVLGQVDDVDGLEGTFLDADTAADAEWLAEVGDFGFGAHFDAELAELDDGTRLFAFLTTLLWFAFLGGDDGDTGEVVAGRVVRFRGLLLGGHLACSVLILW